MLGSDRHIESWVYTQDTFLEPVTSAAMQCSYCHVLPLLKAKGSFHISCTSHYFQLRQHYQVLTSAFLFKKTFLRRN